MFFALREVKVIIYVNLKCIISLINRKFLKEILSNILIKRIKMSINIKKIDIFKHIINNYCLFDLYISNTFND